MVQIWTVEAPSCPLHERHWELTRASVALTSLALLVSSINTMKYLQSARRTTLSTNGCFVQANILIQLLQRGFRRKLWSVLKEQDQREAAIWFEHNMTGDSRGENGKWMVAHVFLGAANNNMGQESL